MSDPAISGARPITEPSVTLAIRDNGLRTMSRRVRTLMPTPKASGAVSDRSSAGNCSGDTAAGAIASIAAANIMSAAIKARLPGASRKNTQAIASVKIGYVM